MEGGREARRSLKAPRPGPSHIFPSQAPPPPPHPNEKAKTTRNNKQNSNFHPAINGCRTSGCQHSFRALVCGGRAARSRLEYTCPISQFMHAVSTEDSSLNLFSSQPLHPPTTQATQYAGRAKKRTRVAIRKFLQVRVLHHPFVSFHRLDSLGRPSSHRCRGSVTCSPRSTQAFSETCRHAPLHVRMCCCSHVI